MTSNFWIGLDLGEDSVAVCVLDGNGQSVLECTSGSTAHDIAECLAEFPPADIAAVAMEPGTSRMLPPDLARLGFPVSVFDPRKTSKVLAVRRNKTDVNDARGIAEIARLGGVPRLAVHRHPNQPRRRTATRRRTRGVERGPAAGGRRMLLPITVQTYAATRF